MKRRVLALIPLPEHTVEALGAEYALSYQPDSSGKPALSEAELADVAAIVTNGSTGCDDRLMATLPSLKVVSSFGAGYEKVDVEAAVRRSVVVTYAPGANAATVADHAIGFALALSRGYCELTSAVKAGRWKQARGERPTLNGAVVGIIGMGRVGKLIARRANAFDAQVAYCALTHHAEVEGRFAASVAALAEDADFLIAACPGGKSTHHLVNDEVLEKLGPEGYLINVSRGSVVDTAALVRALAQRKIAGAGLDVLEEEPDVPKELLALDNVLLTPHVAGRSPASFVAQKDTLLLSLREALEGRSCTFAVPEMRLLRHAGA